MSAAYGSASAAGSATSTEIGEMGVRRLRPADPCFAIGTEP